VSFYRKALGIRRAALPGDHPDLTASLNNLAWLALETRAADAIPLFEEVVALKRRVWPEGHPDLATSLAGLGLALLQRGRASAAEPVIQEALDQRRRMLPEGAWETGVSQSDLGACLLAQGRLAEAEPVLLSGLAVVESQGGPGDVQTRWALERVIALYTMSGRSGSAAPYRERLGTLPPSSAPADPALTPGPTQGRVARGGEVSAR
jgi:hypothetical protein